MPGVGEKLQTEECWAVQEVQDVQGWLSFTGQLHGHNQETVGTLDLGGASTQITFLPQFEVSQIHTRVWLPTPLADPHGAKKGPRFRQQLHYEQAEWCQLMTELALTVQSPWWFLQPCKMSSVICLLHLWFWRGGEGGGTEDNIFRWLWILNSLFAFSVLQKTLEQTPRGYLTSFEMFNSTYKLYTHRWGRGTWSNNILYCVILLTFQSIFTSCCTWPALQNFCQSPKAC